MKRIYSILSVICCLLSIPLAAMAQEFILPMGYQEPWTGKLLFNSEGGYNTGGNHAWEQLYEVQEGDIYTITMPTACFDADYGRVQFKTPITIHADHSYRFIMSLESDKEIPNVQIALNENEDDDICLVSASFNLPSNKKATFTRSNLPGIDIEDAKIALAFPTTKDDITITLSKISIYDLTESRELWTGTSFYNWCYYADEFGQRIPDMEIEGRTETLSWTQADFDDSEWAEAVMPIGNWGAIDGVQTEWPGGDNTNYWFRRCFTLEEIHEKSRYMLNVLHDDSYRIWVNGTLFNEANDWTIGTSAVKLEIPDTLLNVGTNVIAAYVQQNWGGKLYDCGLTEEVDFYEDYDPDADLSKLLINEIQVGNIDQYIDYSYNYGAWAEFYNPTTENIQLDGLYVTDNVEEPHKFQLPTGTGVVKAGGFKVIYFDHNSADGTFGDTAWRQVRFKLQNDGGTLYLFDTDGTLLASADYPELITRCSWARKKDGRKEWGWTGEPSLEASNNNSNFAEFRLEAPQVDTDSRLFTDPFTVRVSIPDGTTLRYTTDGSTPTASKGVTSESGIFDISSTTVLRLCLLQQGMLPSPVVTRSYIYRDHDYYLPVISIATNKDNLYDGKIGVYTDGINGVSGRNHGASNINMDWERPVSFEYITPEGEMAVNQEAEFVISGGWSRHYAPSSFKIKGTNRYEGKKAIDYHPFFRYKPYNKFRQIMVRNGGNDNNSQAHGRVRDAITQQVLMSSGFYCDCQDYQPVHVFFNGRYLAQLNLREPNNRYHGYANYGYDDDEMDAFEYSNGYFQMAGTKAAFNRWKALAQGCSSQNTYQELKCLVDIDEVTNFFAAISYIGCSDWICNNNNVKGYRSLPDGKFRLTLHDQDWGWSNNNGVQLLEGNYGNELLAIYNNMKRGSADFRRHFIDAYCILNGSVFTKDRCLSIGDSICRLVEPALSWEGKEPWTSYNEQKSRMAGQTSRTTRMNALKSAYGLGSGMAVKFNANVPGAAFLINGQPVPGGTFDGTLFAPVTLEASAPAGYNFVGWSKNGTDIVSQERTLRLDTDADTQLQAIFKPLQQECLVAAGSPPVVVNEVSAGNSVAANEYGKRNDWIELYNTTDQDIDLEGMFLTDDPAVPEKYRITASPSGDGAIIPAHGYYIVWADKLDPLRQLHTGFKLANNDEESVTITAADHSWSDCLTYWTHEGEESVGRYPDGGKRIYRMTRPTIHATNTLTSYSEWLCGIDENFDENTYLDAITDIAQDEGSMDNGQWTTIYTVDGMKMNSPQRGINIIRTVGPDGSVSVKRKLVR